MKSPEVVAALGARQLTPKHLERLISLGKSIRSRFDDGSRMAQVYVEQVVMGTSGHGDAVSVGQVDCYINGTQGGVCMTTNQVR